MTTKTTGGRKGRTLTPDTPQTADRPLTLDDVLRSPRYGLTNVTGALEAAAADRLELLLLKRRENRSEAAQDAIRQIGAYDGTHDRFMWLMLTASIRVAFGKGPEAYERGEAVMRRPHTTPEIKADARRLTRTFDLLRLTLWTGVLRRKEVRFDAQGRGRV